MSDHYKAMMRTHGKATCEECGGVPGWDCDCGEEEQDEHPFVSDLEDYFSSVDLVTEKGGIKDYDDLFDECMKNGLDHCGIWEGHGVYAYVLQPQTGKRAKCMIAWEEDNSPVCEECNGEGTLCENESWDNDPAKDEEYQCPVCDGTGCRDDYLDN